MTYGSILVPIDEHPAAAGSIEAAIRLVEKESDFTDFAIYTMRVLENKPGNDVAAALGISEPTVSRRLARVRDEVALEVAGPVSLAAVLDALEARYPMLSGTIRDHVTRKRRPFVRFFACEQGLSHDSPDSLLPDPVVLGAEPLLVVGAMAGG